MMNVSPKDVTTTDGLVVQIRPSAVPFWLKPEQPGAQGTRPPGDVGASVLVWSARDAAESLSKRAKVRVIDPSRPRGKRTVYAQRGITSDAELDAIVERFSVGAVSH